MKASLQKHTLHLREGDWDYLESMFKPNGISTSVAIRTMVSNFVDRKRVEERSAVADNNDLTIEI
jgi:hypothetical protein